MDFVKTPYLPQKTATVFVADCDIENARTLRPPEIECMPPSMRRHADLGICVVSKGCVVCAPEVYAFYKASLSAYGFEVVAGKKKLGGTYPHDCAYNACVVGKICLMNTKISDEVLANTLLKKGITPVHVNQGYAKCSVCVVGKDLILTDDEAIRRAAESVGIRVISAPRGFVRLDGFSYGFIGGATGMLDKHTLLINGIPPAEASFLRELCDEGIKVKYLKKTPVYDIGSIIPLMTT